MRLATSPVPPVEFAFGSMGIIVTISAIANVRIDTKEIFLIFDKFFPSFPFFFFSTHFLRKRY